MVKVAMPQQTNSTDCGIYMILTADLIVSKLLEIGAEATVTEDTFKTLFPPIREADFINKRAQLSMMMLINQHLFFDKTLTSALLET